MRSFNSLLVLALSFFAAVIGIAAMLASGAPAYLGTYIPQSDLMTDYAFGVILAVMCYAIIMFCPVDFSDRIGLMTVWSIKIMVALGFMLYYEEFYPFLDAYSYFALPRAPGFSWEGFVIGDGTANTYNLIWLYYRVFPDSFHALKVFSGFVGLWAVYLFYRAGLIVLGRKDLRLLYLLALFPSILFWSSTIGKEPVVLFAIGLYVYGAVAWYERGHLSALVLLSLGIALSVLVRIWLGPILLAPLLITTLFERHGIAKRWVWITLAVGAFAFILALVREQFAIETIRDLLETIDATSKSQDFGGSSQEVAADLTQPGQFIEALPLAMFTALFRPLPGEVANVFGFIAGIENFALLTLLGIAASRIRVADLRDPVIVWALLFILAWTAAYAFAFISYQNLGTAVRYRVQILPVLLGMLLYFACKRKSPIQRGIGGGNRVTPGG